MRRFFALLLLLITVLLIYLLDNGTGDLPGFGKLLSPTHGLWNNATPVKKNESQLLVIKTPDGDAEVFYDERRVPHIFAPNEKSLYYAQGYVQASDRLWQMDFQVRIAAGKLSEAVGESGLFYDRFFRRSGIPRSADNTVEELNDDPLYQEVVTSYTSGINAYIDQLKKQDYPIEFKLADYEPEPWTLRKSVLLLKLMAFRLSGFDSDVANSNTRAIMDKAAFDDLFPVFPTDESPIIPSGTRWNFRPVPVPVSPYDSISAMQETEADLYSSGNPPIPYQRGIGSNNWAVGSKKTANGGSILCNDPHLGLAFPSIWYEMQLVTPGINVYGVTIPGSPCIIIGFNEQIAWGVTNGSRDVRDWYSVRYKDDQQKEYLFEGEYQPIEERIEVIGVKDGKDFIDTVRWTSVGPILYDGSYGSVESKKGLAVHWLALDVSNELKTFYYLNKAADHDDYMDALDYYANPAQNFAFADREGNVAIREQGKFRVKAEHEGRFVEPLEAQTSEKLSTYIPYEHNPHIYNPQRGFVSSANQHPADSTYPYFFGGWYERYRNRRINSLLDSMSNVTIDDMKSMQNDTYSLMGEEVLPFLMEHLDQSALDKAGLAIVDTLEAWDYFNSYKAHAPSYFQKWFSSVKELLWDELSDSSYYYRIPLDYESHEFMVRYPDHDLIDNKNTNPKETVEMLVNRGFDDMVEYFTGDDSYDGQWQQFNSPSVVHLMDLEAFSHFDLPIGGSQNSINANNQNFGPSWRMIVELTDEGVDAYGVYPGGPSGNPADPNYDAFLDEWAEGRYFHLNFYSSRQEAEESMNAVTTENKNWQ